MNTAQELRNFQRDMVNKFQYGRVPKNEWVEAIQKYSSNLNGYTIDPKQAVTTEVRIKGKLFASRYNRIVISAYGAFIEILPKDLAPVSLSVPHNQVWRCDPTFKINGQTPKHKYIHYTYNGKMVFYQIRTVSYATYRPGCFYISVFNVDSIKT